MKTGIAFVAHCPEVRENQRVVVAGECAELGGWELGDALSLRPAPCGRPWWVSSEVEVNLPECPMGVSGDFVNGVGAGGEGKGVGVSELKFRLLAIPNDGEGSEVPDPDNLVRLEPMKGGDFRVVRLVGAPPLSDCSAVGEKGDNTIHVGAGGGGDHQKREMVGISVEWGVPENVQLALLPRPTNEQPEHPQRQNEYSFPSDPESERACLTSSDEPIQTHEHQSAAAVSVDPAPLAVEFKRSHSHRVRDEGSKIERESERQKVRGKEKEKGHSDLNHSKSVFVCDRPSADTNKTDNRILSSHPPTCPHLRPHDYTRGRRQEEEGQRAQVVPLKPRRPASESGLSEVEADECDQVGGCVGKSKENASWGRGGSVMREEKQRRLTVSVSDSAPLSSELCRGGGVPMGGSNSQGGDGGGEVKRNR
eukprot:Cvel_34537.t1-p1 / transcript=Cvel_34537.t1 / gene=Cvel_34537 / organism=Chromera_velia_CCMP2878 / gene_product=hypothetical protein / transcript_product=hypothetical protein / location=Cvel_scaffold5967:2693-3956(+) / protein_length=421 / sequence_SO=supercontig / SO=protein_coding / is_pseudo=false